MPQWPRQSECIGFYGNPRDADFEDVNIWHVYPPFPMFYITDDGVPQHVEKIAIHRRCAESLARALCCVWELCGRDTRNIVKAGAHIFSGSYANRQMRGAPILSMHAFGCAVDFNATANPYNSGPESCLFDGRHPLVQAFISEGWIWGGDWQRPRDAMHFQAARVG